jgi:tRNA (adenine37-N6)-methyltransferase
MTPITVTPVATVVGGRRDPVDDGWGDVDAIIRFDPTRFSIEAVAGLEEFSHLEVIYRFHLANPAELELGARTPRGNSKWPRVGIFAQRGKDRPNHLGVSHCRLVAIEGLDLHVAGLDAIDGTPVLDVKPHMVEFGVRDEVRQPAWASEIMADYW